MDAAAMTKERYNKLDSGEGNLTHEELKEGWHFCPEWDFMLLSNKHSAEECCCEPYKGVKNDQ